MSSVASSLPEWGIAPLQAEQIDLRHLSERAELCLPALDGALTEAALDAVALELRRQWLQRAHRPADSTLKSPCEGTDAQMPGGGLVSFGYERELDVSSLELRQPLDFPVPAGWSATRVLCRSGQAALSCLLHLVTWLNGTAGALRVHHAGRYFETASLLDLWPPHTRLVLPGSAAAVDLLIGEPVHCDGRFGFADASTLPRARRALLLDTTLSATEVDLAPWFARLDGPLAAVFRSGLKLDQAGLELANVGIVQLFVRDDCVHSLDEIAERLRRVRALTGSGLTLDELAALSAPWVLDASYLRHYSGRIFAHNAALARAIGPHSRLFDDGSHPSLLGDGRQGAVAPFCALRLRQGDGDAHRRLLSTVEAETGRRHLEIANGGSFGFRGSRYELIEPADGRPFLRVALGFRGGANLERLIELLGNLAQSPRAGRSSKVAAAPHDGPPRLSRVTC